MANSRQPLIPHWLWPGLSAAILILSVAALALGGLWSHAPTGFWRSSWQDGFWQDSYLWHILRFTLWQAALSTLLSVLPAILLAQALYRRHFPGRQLLLRLCTMTLVLPVLVAIVGLLVVYGRQGWLAQLCHWIGIDYRFSPYGLSGILLAHVFFNLPLAARLLLQGLEQIAIEQRQLAAQLGMNRWQQWRWLEWPALQRQILPTGALIFMLCFASFAIVMTLGGGPQATTLELAIYQALNYDYDVGRAALLALLQLGCCLGLVLVVHSLSRELPVSPTHNLRWRDPQDSPLLRLWDTLLIGSIALLLLPPLLAVVAEGLNRHLFSVIQQAALWQSAWTSARIALAAGLLALLLTMMLLWSSRELKLRQQLHAGQWLELSGMVILAMPGIVLASGFFLLLHDTVGLPTSPDGIVILNNALMAIPYGLKVLAAPMQDLAQRYNPLCQSLGMAGRQRLRWVELRALRRPIAQALAFATVLSIGDFGIVALFGNETFRTLPFYLYQQMGAYRSQDAAVTALLLLLLSFLLFTLIERVAGRHADT